MYKTLATMTPTQDEILDFANSYGALGGRCRSWMMLTGERGAFGAVGEKLAAWQQEILLLSQTVRVWEQAKNGSEDSLGRHFKWEGAHTIRYDSHPAPGGTSNKDRKVAFEQAPGAPLLLGSRRLNPDYLPRPSLHVQEIVSSKETHPYAFKRFERGNLIAPAKFWLLRTVNEMLGGEVAAKLVWDAEQSRPILRMVPQSLIGACWLQFAGAIDAETEYERCLMCREWYESSAGTRARDKKFCSVKCRVKAYRDKQTEARELRGRGLKIRDIAKKVGSDAKTVGGWLRDKRR